MSSSPISADTKRFLAYASLIVVGTAAVAAIASPAVSSFRAVQSVRISQEGERVKGEEAQLDFRIAYALDHTNATAASAVAGQRFSRRDLRGTLDALATAGTARAADRIRAGAALEDGQLQLAVAAADRLIAPGATDDDLGLASSVYGATGKSDRLAALLARVASPEATKSVLRAVSGYVALAEELRARGLLVSSRRVLVESEASVPRNLLLARLIQADGRKQDLPQIEKLLHEALAADPTNLGARTKLVANLRAQKQGTAADAQQKLLDTLKSGRP